MVCLGGSTTGVEELVGIACGASLDEVRVIGCVICTSFFYRKGLLPFYFTGLWKARQDGIQLFLGRIPADIDMSEFLCNLRQG